MLSVAHNGEPGKGPTTLCSSLKEDILTGKYATEREKRLETLNLVSLTHKDAEGRVDLEIVGRTLDLSEGGILLEITEPVPPGNQEVYITLGIQDHVFDAAGEIVHQRRLENGNLGVGISFKDHSPERSSVIANFLCDCEKR